MTPTSATKDPANSRIHLTRWAVPASVGCRMGQDHRPGLRAAWSEGDSKGNLMAAEVR